MTEILSEDVAWWRALTLEERCRSVVPAPWERASGVTARRRMAQWRSQTPFAKEEWFARLLDLHRLDEGAFTALLGEEDASLRQRLPEVPNWLSRLEQVFEAPRAASGRLPPIVGPLIVSARERLESEARDLARRLPGGTLDPEAIAEQLLSALLVRVDRQISRAVVLEMRVASLQGRLTGADQAERFRSFVDRLRELSESLSFLRQYPVLARSLVESTEALTEAGIELLDRIGADWQSMRELFWPDRDPGMLTSLEMGLGDVHRSGREVCVLVFDSGARLVYKPRSPRIDHHFALLLRWLHERGAPELRTPRILDRGTHGWAEFIHHTPCLSLAEARRFYERQGALLAVLYALNANDFHRENLIAAGEHPVPIDLETLCGPDYGQGQEAAYDSYAEFELASSVVKTLLLPVFQEEGGGQKRLDTSGLGGRSGQFSIHLVGEWENLGTDELRLAFERREIPPVPNRPQLDGSALNAFDFAAEIEAGFTSMYHRLESLRDELLSEGGPIAAMGDDEVRVVLRGSQLYSMLIEQSFHPDHLSDALERDRLFARLWFGIDRTEFPHIALRLLPSEIPDLCRGEIPYFTTLVDSRDLWTSQGAKLESFFLRSSSEVIRDRFQQLGEEDLRRQTRFIRGSLGAIALDHESTFQRYTPPTAAPPAARDRLLVQAVKVAERLIELASWRNGHASWVGLSHGESHGWHLRPLQTDLYSGLPGLILFLAYLGDVTGRGDLRSVAEAALETLRHQLKRRRDVEFLGGFHGLGGLLYLWLHLFHLWEDEAFLAEARSTASRLAEIAGDDRHLDVIQGSAGSIAPLLSLHELTGLTQPLMTARSLGDRLLQLARPWDGGIGWLSALVPTRPLTGFAHGGAGFSWALGELFTVTGEEDYSRGALQATAYERSYFSLEQGNWEDLRQASQERGARYMVAWCHGACGIGMSRLRLQGCLDDAEIRQEARAALDTTYLSGFGSNHSLCHGDMGSLELLLQASRCLPEVKWQERLAERTAQTLASAEQQGWRCGVPLDVETPGLMDGLAGIGYGFLRLAEPDRVPAVMILEGPGTASRLPSRPIFI
ncbi:MAG TPA: type 2 lanthipeptide synthetase LanM family protein [Thermoanaerobaculia bacterium]|nr:type 2 lanthipeptide synthetase LanM family protein [Thermoanaerobaculia bacterium]